MSELSTFKVCFVQPFLVVQTELMPCLLVSKEKKKKNQNMKENGLKKN